MKVFVQMMFNVVILLCNDVSMRICPMFISMPYLSSMLPSHDLPPNYIAAQPRTTAVFMLGVLLVVSMIH